MAYIPTNSLKPWVNPTGVVWLASWSFVGLLIFFSNSLSYSGGLFVVALAIGLIGAWPQDEGPLWIRAVKRVRFKWASWTRGTVIRRDLKSTSMVLHKGVTPMKGLFKVEIVELEFSGLSGKLTVPALMSRGRHVLTVESGTIPQAALADPEVRETHEDMIADLFSDIAATLGEGNSFTQWSLVRDVDTSRQGYYLSERGGNNSEKRLEELTTSIEEIYEGKFKRRRGINLTADNPSSWKPRTLANLTQDQLMQSPAVRASLLVEDAMASAGIEGAKVCSVPVYNRLIYEVFNVKNLELYRHRSTGDIITSKVAESENVDLDDLLLLKDVSPLPQMQREAGVDYLIFDGTYHRVLWISRYISKGDYSGLFTAPCNYFASVYCDIKLASNTDSATQDRVRLTGEGKQSFKRNVTAEDEQELNEMDQGRYDALQYGPYVVFMRTLVIVSGESYEAMNDAESILISHLTRKSIRVEIKPVPAPDAVEWFFAALGVFGKG